MPSLGVPPPLSFPWYTIPVLLLIYPFCMSYDRYKIWRLQRVRRQSVCP